MTFALALLFLTPVLAHAKTNPSTAERCVQHYAAAYRVSPEMIAAFIDVESQWNPRALSNKGAMGLMQLMPATARRSRKERAMENAHLRLGLLEYQRFTEKISTRIRVRVDRFVGEGRKAHLLSVFGNDSDIGAITAAVQDKASFTLTFPDGAVKEVSLGEHASCYKGSLTLPDRKHPVRHLLAVSQELHTNGGAGRTILMRYCREEAWATLVSFLGIPGDPAWTEHVLDTLDREERVTEIDGIGCQPVLISASAEEMLDWIGQGLRSHKLALPESNGPIRWPAFSIHAVLENQLR